MASKRVDQIAGHLNFPKGLLAGQVAIVTGSGQGIGAETALLHIPLLLLRWSSLLQGAASFASYKTQKGHMQRQRFAVVRE